MWDVHNYFSKSITQANPWEPKRVLPYKTRVDGKCPKNEGVDWELYWGPN